MVHGPSIWRRGQVQAWAFAGASLLALRPTHAAAAACDIAAALTDLTADQRGALTRTCGGEAVAEPDLHAAIFRAVALDGWRGAALARLLEPLRTPGTRVLRGDLAATPPDFSRAQASLKVGPAVLAGPACADLRKAVATFASDTRLGQRTGAPILHDDPALARCLGVDATVLQDVRLLMLHADNVDELFVAAAVPGHASLTWLDPRDALVFERDRFFVVAAPADAPLTAVARRANAGTPAVWHGILSHDAVAWAEAPAMTCLDLAIAHDPTITVYLDGAPLPRDAGGLARSVAVTRDTHELVAVACPADGACHVRHREAIAGATLQRRTNQCLPLRLDLIRRPRRAVAILGATQGERCREAPLRADGIRQGAADHLSSGTASPAHEFRDLEAFAAATDALASLRGRLNPAAGATTGAATGADGLDVLGTAAKEAWRQGIADLLSFDLQCTHRDDGWTYRLIATRIDLDSVFSRGLHGGESLDLRAFLEQASEDFNNGEHLPVALASAIDRSLGTSYLRLVAPRTRASYRRGVELAVKHHAAPACIRDGCPDRNAEVVTRRLSLGGAIPDVCRELATAGLRSPAALARAGDAIAGGGARTLWTGADVDPQAALHAHERRVRLRGVIPGWYLVVARADAGSPVRDALCVELAAPVREVWGDVALSLGGLHVAPSSTPDQFYIRTRVGYTHYLRPIVGLGVFVGHAHTAYAWATGRPAWQDLGVDDEAPLRWSREALLLGGHVELRTRHPRMPVDLRLRAAPTLSVGFLRLRKVPLALEDFRGDRGDATVQLDVDLDLHFDAAIGYDIGKVAVQHLLLLGVHAIDDRMRSPPNNVRDSAGVFIGLGLGLGGAP